MLGVHADQGAAAASQRHDQKMRTFDDLVPDAEALARAWMHAAQEGAAAETTRERRTTRRLARLVADPDGLELALRFVDRVVRPRDDAVAAQDLAAQTGERKVGRNDPCPCGSGKKYKYCCMNK